jgi:hypothetical protein
MDSGRFRQYDPRTATFTMLGMINWVAWWYVPGRPPGIDELSDTKRSGSTVPEVIDSIRQDLDRLEWLTSRS